MDLQKKLQKLGIENVRKIDDRSIRIIAYNVVETLTKTFPIIYDEYNNILIKLLNCDMYVARVTKPISKVNYIYENNSIYFDENINLNQVDEQMIHECIHYLQDYRNTKGKLDKLGLCNFEEFSISGFGLNEAAVQYISAKSVENQLTSLERYGKRIKTISPNYYPFLTNLMEQIVYLAGEDTLIKDVLRSTQEFTDYILNTFESNTKKIVNKFDELIELNNLLNSETNMEKAIELQNQIANCYDETQNMIFSTYFEKICPKINSAREVDIYMEKAIKCKNIRGKTIQDGFLIDDFYDAKIKEIVSALDKKLYAINKAKSRNTLLIVSQDKIMRFIRRILSYFSA